MVSLKLPLAAVILTISAVAPAVAQEQMHRRTVVTHNVVTRHSEEPGYHHGHRVCSKHWRHHHRVRTCHWIR
ncbi:hypothetical protein [Rhizorhabdus argentea]|uniref:hypothetical protein n=1 Tax=Rhizorhabdus argentea TaxID=1387174 RepID=UPI0030EE7502